MSLVYQKDSEVAYNKIVDLLQSRAISEDVFLSERALSAELGLGRTPIREALRDLIRDGLLESHPTRGTLLKMLSVTDLQDLYEIRFAIEGLAAALASERGNVSELEPFVKLYDGVLRDPESHDLSDVHDRGVQMHEKIIAMTNNKRLLEMYRPFRIRFRIPFGIIKSDTPERVIQSAKEHREIALSIMSRNAVGSETLIRQHLRESLSFRINLLVDRTYYASLKSA